MEEQRALRGTPHPGAFTPRASYLFRILVFAVVGATFALAVPSQIATSPAQDARATNETRFPVAHARFGSPSFGYLFVSADGIRYEVVRPDNDKEDSFTIARSNMKVIQAWNLFGQIQNAAEIKTARATYHLWLLKSDADVEGMLWWNPNNTAQVAPLIQAIQGKNTIAARGTAGSASSRRLADPSDAAAPAGSSSNTAQPGTPLSPGAIEGIYYGWDSPISAGVRNLFFTRDGWVFRDFPEEGIAGLDLTAFRNDPRRNKSWTGRYRLEEDRIYILWQDYADDREVIHRREDVANAPWDTYVPTCDCTGKRFSGIYHYGLAASGQDFRFFLDGTFIDNRVTDQMIVSNPFVPGRYEHPRVLQGTYSIQDHTLTLNFADGRRIRRIFLAPKAQEDQQVFDWINLGGQRLYEQHFKPQP